MAKISGLRNKNALEMGIETGQLSFLKHRISPAMAKASPTRLIKSEGRLPRMGSQGERERGIQHQHAGKQDQRDPLQLIFYLKTPFCYKTGRAYACSANFFLSRSICFW